MPTVASGGVNVTINTKTIGQAEITRLANSMDRLTNSFVKYRGNARRARSGARGLRKEMNLLNKAVANVNRGFQAFIVFNISRAVTDLAFSIGSSISEFQKLESVLLTTGLSADKTTATLDRLGQVAADLPGTTSEVTNAFVRLRNLNLDASEGSLRDFANLSAGLGRDLGALIEAVADASTFEFERLKEEFGIIARQTDETVRFTFQGTTTEVEKTAAAVQEYLRGIAQSNFAGAAENQTEVLSVAWTNLADAVGSAVRDIDNSIGGSKFFADLFNDTGRRLRVAFDNAGLKDLQTAYAEVEGFLERFTPEQIANAKAFEFADSKAKNFANTLAIAFTAEGRAGKLLATLEKIGNEIDALTEDTTLQSDPFSQALTSAESSFQKLGFSIEKEVSKLKKQLTPLEQLEALRASLIAQTPELAENEKFISELERIRDIAREATSLISNTEAEKARAKAVTDATAIIQGSLDEFDGAVDEYLRKIDTLNNVGSGVQGNNQALRERLRSQALEEIINSFGDIVLSDGSARLEALYQQQTAVVQKIYDDTDGRLDAVNALRIERQKKRAELLQEAFESSVLAVQTPEQNFRDQLIADEIRFLGELDQITEEQAVIFQKYKDNLVKGFVLENTDLSSAETLAGALATLDAAATSFGANFDARNAETVFRVLSQEFGAEFGTADNSLRNFNAREEQIRALSQQSTITLEEEQKLLDLRRQNQELLTDIQTRSAQESINTIVSGNATILDNDKTTGVQRVAIALQTASNLTSVWNTQSRGLFNITKELDRSIAAMNYYVAVSEEIKTFGLGKFGAFGSLINIGALTAQFAGIISEIENRSFGDSSIGNVGGGGAVQRSSLREEVTSNRQREANVNVVVYGSILDEGGFRQAIADGTREALDNDELIINQNDIRTYGRN